MVSACRDIGAESDQLADTPRAEPYVLPRWKFLSWEGGPMRPTGRDPPPRTPPPGNGLIESNRTCLLIRIAPRRSPCGSEGPSPKSGFTAADADIRLLLTDIGLVSPAL